MLRIALLAMLFADMSSTGFAAQLYEQFPSDIQQIGRQPSVHL